MYIRPKTRNIRRKIHREILDVIHTENAPWIAGANAQTEQEYEKNIYRYYLVNEGKWRKTRWYRLGHECYCFFWDPKTVRYNKKAMIEKEKTIFEINDYFENFENSANKSQDYVVE